MNFYSDGTTIGVSLTIWGLLFIAYSFLEIYSIYKTRMLFIHKLLIYIRVKRNIKKTIPSWWKLNKIYLFQFFSVREKDPIPYMSFKSGINCKPKIKLKNKNEYTIVLPIDCIRSIDGLKIGTWLGVNIFGKIKDDSYLNSLNNYDKGLPKEVQKQYKRDSILEELGI